MTRFELTGRGISFEVPQGLVDETVPTFASPTCHLTVATDALKGALGAYVTSQIDQLAVSVAGFSLRSREERSMMGCAAVVLEQRMVSPEGRPLRQHQGYVQLKGSVVIVTATGEEPAGETVRAAVETVLRTMTRAPEAMR